MLYDNSYNRQLQAQLHAINQRYINHSKFVGGAAIAGAGYNDSESDRDSEHEDVEKKEVEGGSGFAEGTYRDTGADATLGASPSNGKGIETTEMVGGKIMINTDSQKLMGGNEDYDRKVGAGFWDDFKSGFDKVVDTVGNVASTASKVIPVVQAAAPIVSKLMGGKKKGRKAKGGALNKHGLTDKSQLHSVIGGQKENQLGQMQDTQDQIKNAQLAFGGKKLSGAVLKFINKIEPHLKLGKQYLEKYDKDEKISVPKLLFDVYNNLSGNGKKVFTELDDIKGAGLIGDIFGAIGLGKDEIEGGYKLSKLMKPRNKMTGGFLQFLPMLASAVAPTLISKAIDMVRGKGEIDGSTKEELDNLPKSNAIGGKKKSLKDRIKKGSGLLGDVLGAVEGGKKKSEYSILVKKIMNDNKMKMIDAIKYIKDNGLYKKK
jgi:hypothetical protein